jgi:hypothetical protein
MAAGGSGNQQGGMGGGGARGGGGTGTGGFGAPASIITKVK